MLNSEGDCHWSVLSRGVVDFLHLDVLVKTIWLFWGDSLAKLWGSVQSPGVASCYTDSQTRQPNNLFQL